MKTSTRVKVFFAILLIAHVFDDVELKCFEKKKPIVHTKAGWLEGKIIENDGSDYYSFKGVPYAEPPVGDLRFRDPVPKSKWDGIRQAFEHGNNCLNHYGFSPAAAAPGGDEDCLFLNVYTPNLDGKKPVMFWVHGGGFFAGSGDSTIYGPEPFMKEDVILVTINYRLSAFGFLNTYDENAPGNAGMKDMVLALKWVKKNIKKFGGDPDNVTIFGQSSGAAAIHFLLISDLTEGLIDRAILLSGAAFMPVGFQPDPRTQAETLGHRLNLTFSNTKELVDQLRALPYQDIVNVETFLFDMPSPYCLRPLEFIPSIEPEGTENAFLTEDPLTRMINGNFHKVPIMLGSTDFDGMIFLPYFSFNSSFVTEFNANSDWIVPMTLELQPNTSEMTNVISTLRDVYFDGSAEGTVDQWLNAYTDFEYRSPADRVASFYSESGQRDIFTYEFNYDGALNLFKKRLGLDQLKGACHGDELLYVFGTSLPGFEPDETAKIVRKRMTKLFADFARYGNPTPTVSSLINEIWTPYTTSEKSVYVFGEFIENRGISSSVRTLSELYESITGHF